ncbi:siphovirus Gp157 family protein [Phormidesmis sp. 146-35]
MPKTIPPSIALRSLKGISILAAQTWRHLNGAETPEQETEVLEQLWLLQDSQEAAIDAHAELADQIDAELVAIKARMEHLIKIHVAEIERLTRWRESLDHTILQLNESGLIASEVAGQQRRIRIKLNPPSCEVVDMSQVPTEYITVKVVEERRVNKTAVKDAWKRGIPVAGTQVERRRKVVYELAPTSLERMKVAQNS